MTKFEKFMLGAMAILIVCVVGLALSLKKVGVSNILGSAQTAATYATGPGVTNMGGLYLWDTDSDSGLEVAGYSHFAGTFASAGDTRLATMVKTGAVAVKTNTTSITAAEVCNSGLITGTPATSTGTYTFPATSTLFADCLTTNGDSVTVPFANLSASTSTILAAGTGCTAFFSSTLTIAASDTALLTFVRSSATACLMLVTNQPS